MIAVRPTVAAILFALATACPATQARGGIVENIFVRNLPVPRVSGAILSIEFRYGEGTTGPHRSVLRHLDIANLSSPDCPRVLRIFGIPNGIIDDIRLAGCSFGGVKRPDMVEHAGRIVFENVSFAAPSKP